MRKAKTLEGLSVIARTDGKHLGTVRDLIFSDNSQKLIAFLLSDRNLFGMMDATCVPWTQVRQIGTDALMVESEESVIGVRSDALIAEAYDSKARLSGQQVITDGGDDLGHISDVYLDDSGYVSAFEVSGGLFADAYGGKRYLETPSQLRIGQDVIIVPHDVIDRLELQSQTDPGGLKGLYASAADKVGGAVDTAKDKYEDIASASVDKQREYVVGKVAGRDVIIPAERATMATPAALSTNAVETNRALLSQSQSPATSGTFGSTVTSGDLADAVRTTGELEIEDRGDEVIVRPSDTGSMGSNAQSASSTAPSSTPGAQMLTELQRATPASATDVSSSGDVVDGEVLVRQGETITQAHADRAVGAGVLAQLVAAATMTSAQGALGSAQSTASGYGSQVQDSLGSSAIGKPAGREVDAPDGSVLVAPGQIITQALLDRADTFGKKNEVIASATLGGASVAAQDTFAQAKEAAGSAWETIKEKVAELTGTAQEKKAELDEANLDKKIKNAVGRPVTRVILANDDTVILNTGDIITNRAVEDARHEDVLDILLDSVYDSTPDITPEMLRLQGKGKDALATQAEPSGGPITATVAPQAS